MNYHHYTFVADILVHNPSHKNIKELKDFCRALFEKERELHPSSVYWTRCKITYYINSNSLSYDGIVRFEIFDADSVARLKELKRKLREGEKERFHKFVTHIETRHFLKR